MTDTLLNYFELIKFDFTEAYLIPDGGGEFSQNFFDINPKDFFRFAKLDLKQNDDRGYMNSLTNAKRAIDCQVDEVFIKYGLNPDKFGNIVQSFIENFDLKRDIPIKLRFMQALNLAPSLLISKARGLRNRLEHLYQRPLENEVTEALDIADLFIRSIEGKTKILTNSFSLTDGKNHNQENDWTFKTGISFTFECEEKIILIEAVINNKTAQKFKITTSDIEYWGIIRLMNSIGDEIEIEESLKIILKLIGHKMPINKVTLYQG